MKSAFRKISRVRHLGGFTRWYLSEDCLLSAKQVMYSVEYRRFYLRDLESVVVWPSRLWPLRLIIPGVLFGALSALFLKWIHETTGLILLGLGVSWVLLEFALGPTARSRIQFTGASVELPLVNRTRRANKVLGKIDAAVRAARGATQQQTGPAIAEPAEPFLETKSEASATASIAPATETHAS